jgi:formate hydrogenlyase subunit 3/multisubunit Na+/H+ antiporter MnhD subunit
MAETTNFNPVLLIAVPLGLAFLIPLLGLISRKIAKWLPVIGFLFNLIISLLILPHSLKKPIIVKIAGFAPPFGINLVAGPVGMLLAISYPIFAVIDRRHWCCSDRRHF